jgi:glycosyltransferase involved in cell wall biosynthesis
MKLSCVTIAYKEERFMPKFIQSMQDRVDEIVVLNSIKPWNGDPDEVDNTGSIARSLGATVINYDWKTEQDQRNAGQQYCMDSDWIIVLDPDEYILDADWTSLVAFLETAELDAYVPFMQHTYWKTGFVIDPPEDYKQIIAVRPHVRFVDKRVVDSPWYYAPIELHHMSWARSDEECLKKISTYAHAKEFDTLKWFSEVWQSDQTENLHPLTPDSLKKAVRVQLPEELERLNLWPS